MTHDFDPATLGIHADSELNETSAISPPIYQTTTFRAEDADTFLEMATEPHHPGFYTRYGNPNAAQAEAILAKLEGTDAAILTASGMAAITAIAMHFLSAGDHVVAQTVHYSGTTSLFEKVLHKFGVSHSFVDQTSIEAFEKAIQPNTRMLIVETPTNPLMHLTDLEAIAQLGKANNILTVADNTFATPINQRPATLGIDLVFHSATKYLGGHHDVVIGAIAGSQTLIEDLWRTYILLGASVNGFDSWLLLRGLRTLKLRVQQHNQNALAVARYLAGHPKIKAVYYPGLDTHPQHDLAVRQMSGYTGMLSFELDSDYAAADRFINGLTLIERAASLGGVHSLIVHPAAMWAQSFTPDELDARGIPSSLVRLSVGLEDVNDLIADIENTLASL